MLAKITALLEKKTPRERLLVFLLLWAVVLFWFFTTAKKQGEISSEVSALETKKGTAEFAVSQRDVVENNLRRARESFDESKMKKDLRVEVESMLRTMNLTYSMAELPESSSGKMITRAVAVTLRGVSLQNLIDFEARLMEAAPYISAGSVEFSSDGKGGMSAKYEIMSFEFK